MASAAERITPARIGRERAQELFDRLNSGVNGVFDVVLEIRDAEAWLDLGYASFREAAQALVNRGKSEVYKILEAAYVVREIEDAAAFHHGGKPANVGPDPRTLPIKQLTALAKAPEGARAEVLRIAAEASDGRPTEKIVRAAVEAKLAEPDAAPADLVKTVVDGQARAAKPRPVVPDAVEEIREEREEQAAKRDELTDEEWLATLPLESKLAGHVLDKFRRDALYFRDFEPTRRGLIDFHGKAKKRRFKGTSSQGFVPFRVGQLLQVGHPRAWLACRPTDQGGCGGAGVVGAIGECPMCHGRGYIAK